MPDAQIAPAASCVTRNHTSIHHRYAEQSDIPCAMVLRLIRDLPGVPGLIAPSPCTACRAEGRHRQSAGLDTISENQIVGQIIPATGCFNSLRSIGSEGLRRPAHFVFGRRQQMTRKIDRVGNQCRDDGAADDGSNECRILRLTNDAVRQSKK